ncbi:unnamed protein product [Penicillium manginii]
MSYILSRAAQYMLQEYNIRSRDPLWDSNSDFASISSDLLYVESENDGSDTVLLSKAHLQVFSRALFYLSHCLLNHPFLLRHRLQTSNTQAPPTFLSRCFEVGRSCARHLALHLTEAQTTGSFLNTSFYGYCAVVVGAIHALYVHSPDEGIKKESFESLNMSLDVLKDIGRYWENVSVMFDTLQQFWRDSSRFHMLTTSNTNIRPFPNADQEIMWSLVDYSTMSSAIKSTQAYDASVVSTIEPLFDLFNSNTLVSADERAFYDSMVFPPSMGLPAEALNGLSMDNLNRMTENS